MLYKKKPVVVEAIKWDGLNLDEIMDFVGKSLIVETYDAGYQAGATPLAVGLKIRTLEGDMNVSFGDYIIKGVKGEFYPCKPDIFEQTYEPPSIIDCVQNLVISCGRGVDKRQKFLDWLIISLLRKDKEAE